MNFPISKNERLLCPAIAQDSSSDRTKTALELVSVLGDQAAFEFAKKNEVEAIIAHSLQKDAQNRAGSPVWNEAHQSTHDRIAAYLSELDRLAECMHTKNIPLIALKNGGIARGIYPCPGCCPMGDLDLLVKRSDFKNAHAVMLDQGYTFKFRSSLEKDDIEEAEKTGGAEYWKLLQSNQKLWVEIQWRPVAGRWIREDQEPVADELFDRSVQIPGTRVKLLAPEDNLLQVCLHTAKHSYVRAPGFRLHTDVDRIVHFQKIDWDVFVTRVKKLQVKTAVFFSLLIPSILFNTPVPQAVLDNLSPAGWKKRLIGFMINRAGIFNPKDKKFSKSEYIVFNALLYDSFFSIFLTVFPSRRYMKKRYPDTFVLIAYLQRCMDLLFRRHNP